MLVINETDQKSWHKTIKEGAEESEVYDSFKEVFDFLDHLCIAMLVDYPVLLERLREASAIVHLIDPMLPVQVSHHRFFSSEKLCQAPESWLCVPLWAAGSTSASPQGS